MSVAELLKNRDTTAFSIEVLPPLRGMSIEQVYKSIDNLMEFAPTYINITTHRSDVRYVEVEGGVFQRIIEHKRPGTVAIAAALKSRYNVPTVPHVICSGFTPSEIENELIDLQYLGITDLLLLRGDRIASRDICPDNEYEHTIDLCRQVEAFNLGKMVDGAENRLLLSPFTYGVAGYPEKHEEAMNIESDISHLKAKIEAGAQYVVTQMFFDNRRYFEFVERCRAAGITVPIIPGIKPLTSLKQQTLLPKTFHLDFPAELATEFSRCRTNEDVKALGVEWGIAQARELKAANVPSIHFYSMNASSSIERIAKEVY